ncbi:uncharacterized protein PAC_09588 [Phialocephala subalpina]|uniref:DUF7598 domain-containing protein n=1 Tax=Phialocephala subalpina TaxID=576137 RepID=A0A1L7X3U0_9HELO|nr:uncharacterized protein PAC_09588 [Phialocephala subalpina]
MFSESKLAGPGYITLNVIRVLNIISLLLVAIGSWIMLVMTVKTSSFYLFDGVSHFITSVISIFLIVSELNVFRSYFARDWPLLSSEHGFVFLGTSMFALGFNILGNLNKPATSIEKLGLPLWRVVIAGGILTSIMGFFNVVATFVFCDSKLGITGRQVRSDGAAIPSSSASGTGTKAFSLSSGSIRRSESPLPSYNVAEEQERRKSRFPQVFGRLARPKNFSISKPVLNDPEQFQKWESRSSPVAPEIQRPPTALHPAYNHGIAHDYPAPPPIPGSASSRYSVTSQVTHPFADGNRL